MNTGVPQLDCAQGSRLEVLGVVQGVGFRPQVLRLAREYKLTGSVRNEGTSAIIEAFGSSAALLDFEKKVRELHRGPLRVDHVLASDLPLPPQLPAQFDIAPSAAARPGLGVAPDVASCSACVAETLDPFSRRYRYAFTACAECGPRLSVFNLPPYDRAHTTLAPFTLCSHCLSEYQDSTDRRFHAQAIACYACGPQARLQRLDGRAFSLDALSFLDDVDAATSLLGKGEIVLIKGMGGYQLACDATHPEALTRLRQLKAREAKPFALLARDLDMVKQWCEVDEVAERALLSASAPIVLLPRRATAASSHPPLPETIAMGLSHLGVMLPCTTMHHLLMRRRRAPIVLTSGNHSDEPQAITRAAAELSFRASTREPTSAEPVVNYVLDHNRDIARRVDDSVGRVIAGHFRVMRRARGYAPAPLALPPGFDPHLKVLALGGDLKNTFAMLRDGYGVLSQHMGDLHNAATQTDQQHALRDYLHFYDFEPDLIACDRHPGNAATQRAGEQFSQPLTRVGHHHAHIAACLGEHGWPLNGEPVLGIALDGLGLGEDDQWWGGEFLLSTYAHCERVGTFKPVALLGGDLAAREPWRNTYAQIMAEMGWARFAMNFKELELFEFLSLKPRELLNSMLSNATLAPRASSVGRLFDAVAAAIGICRERVAYEGEAAMRLESLITAQDLSEDAELDYPFSIPRLSQGKGLPYIEPLGMWQALLGDLILQTPPARMAARFHRGLANAVVAMAAQLAEQHGLRTVALSGGVFQNRILTERVLQGLTQAGLTPLLPQAIPVNDGGLAWGQALIALAQYQTQRTPARRPSSVPP